MAAFWANLPHRVPHTNGLIQPVPREGLGGHVIGAREPPSTEYHSAAGARHVCHDLGVSMLARSSWGRGLGVVLVAGAVALGAAACGDSNESSSTVSEEEFVTEGNAICEAGNERIAMAEDQAFPDDMPTDENFEQFFAAFTADIDQQITELSALEPPEDLQDEFDAFLEKANTTLEQVRSEGAEAFFSETESGEQPFAETNRLASEIGLDACASGAAEEG